MKFKPYPEYKDSGFEWIGEIPQEWDIIKIKFISDVIMGQSPKSEDYNFEGVGLPFLQGTAEFGEKSPDPIKYCNNANKYSEIGDILISVRAPVGETNLSNQKFAIGRGLAAIRTVEPLKSYLWYGVDVFKILFNYISSGSTYDAVSIDEVKSMVVSVPTKAEQEKITSFLDKKTSEIDLTIEKDTRLIELLKEKRTALINQVVTKGLDPTVKMKDSGVEWIGEIPEECEITRLKFFTSLFGGYAFKSNDFSDSGIQLIRIGNLYKNRLALERKPVYLPKDYSEIYPQYLLRKGDIIISMTGTVNKEDYGYTVQIGSTKPFLMNQRVGKFRVDETKINKKYFKYVLESRIFLDSLYSIPSGTKQANLSPENILNIKIYVFHLSKQQEIVDYLDEKTHQIDKTIQKIQENIELLEEYKKSLIHHVVTGKVDVREVAV